MYIPSEAKELPYVNDFISRLTAQEENKLQLIQDPITQPHEIPIVYIPISAMEPPNLQNIQDFTLQLIRLDLQEISELQEKPTQESRELLEPPKKSKKFGFCYVL